MGYSMVQVDELPPEGPGGEEETQQEEVNVVIAGSGVYRRVPIAGPEGMTMVAVGARHGSYEPRGPF